MAVKNNNTDLLSITSRVEVPFVVVKIAEMTIGQFQRTQITNESADTHQYINVTYPNYVKSLVVKKNANGIVNEYTLSLVYAVTEKDDPNLIEKILSKAKDTRKISFSYGDYNVTNFIFSEEQALITSIKQNMSLSSHTITYVIKAVSNNYVAAGAKYSFPAIQCKGSDLIKKLLFSTTYKLTSLFYGMKTLKQVITEGFIASDDMVVTIEAQTNMSILEYLKYVVSCMRWAGNTGVVKTSIYKIAVYDDIRSEYGGPYFKVVRFASADEIIDSEDLDYINIDVGYPDKTAVIDFTITDDDSFAILYDYSGTINQSQIVYKIGDDGTPEYQFTEKLMQDDTLKKVTEAERTWWAKMTSYPINAKLTLRGLIRNVELMSMVRINVYFYGKKHIYSGIYTINGQQDSVDDSGYRTTLTLLRVGGVNL